MNIATKPRISKSTAIGWAGSPSELARRLDVTTSAVSQWDETLPDGRVWQLHALGCPNDAHVEQAAES
jgi:DNA-binding transcriptional regulator YdaS (Cro superfamily)